MYNYIIIGSVIIICVCSIILILRKLKDKKSELSAVPISDIHEIKTIKKAYAPKSSDQVSLRSDPIDEDFEDGLGEEEIFAEQNLDDEIFQELEEIENEQKEFDKLKKDLAKDNIMPEKKSGNETENLKHELSVLKDIFKKESEYFIKKIEELEKEKFDLKEALFKEVSLREESPALDEEKEESENESQFAGENEASKGLHDSNQRLLERIQNQKESIRHFQDQIKKIKSQSYEIQNEDRYKIEELESKLSDVICQKEKLEQEYQDIEKLTTYNLKLRMKMVAYSRALKSQKSLLESYEHNSKTKELQMKSIISELKMENANLIGKVKDSVASVGNLREQIAQIKENMQERMKQLIQGMGTVSASAEELSTMKIENDRLKRAMKNAEIKIQALTEERQQLLTDVSRNELNYRKLKELNTHILEKEKMLQYELTKSRAKALGLEKICEDFKLHIEKSDRKPNRMDRIKAS